MKNIPIWLSLLKIRRLYLRAFLEYAIQLTGHDRGHYQSDKRASWSQELLSEICSQKERLNSSCKDEEGGALTGDILCSHFHALAHYL